MRHTFRIITLADLARGVVCLKRRHRTPKEAWRVVAKMKDYPDQTQPYKLAVYYCRECSGWHVGHKH